jgi:Tfp pilus assembly protein PilN
MPLVKAVQEVNSEVEMLTTENETLKTDIKNISKLVNGNILLLQQQQKIIAAQQQQNLYLAQQIAELNKIIKTSTIK